MRKSFNKIFSEEILLSINLDNTDIQMTIRLILLLPGKIFYFLSCFRKDSTDFVSRDGDAFSRIDITMALTFIVDTRGIHSPLRKNAACVNVIVSRSFK